MDNLAALLLVVIPALLNLGILLYILFELPRVKVINIFALFLIALFSWQAYDIVARVSPSMEIVQYIDRLLNFSWLATGVLLLHFVLIFTGRDKWSNRQYFLYLYLPYFIILSLSVAQENYTVLEQYDFWGWVRTDLNWIEYTQRAFIAIPVVITLVLLFIHAYQNKNNRDVRLQSLLIATGILIPSIFGLYAQLFYPSVNGVEIPITSTFMTFLSIAIIISLRNYHLFSLHESLNIQKTLEGLSGYVMILDENQRVIFKNKRIKKCFNPSKHPKKSYEKLDDYFPTRELGEKFIENVIQPTWDGETISYFETQFMTHADNVVYVNISAELIKNNNVKQGIMIIATDVSRQKKAEKERKDILESITDGFFAVDHNWVVTYWNRAAETMLKMPKENIEGKNLWSVYTDAIPLRFYKEYHSALENQEARHFEEYYPALKMWLQVSAFPKKDGLTVYFRDISKDKRQQQEILRIKKNREALINSTTDLIWAVNREYHLITANTAFFNFIEKVSGKSIHEGQKVLMEEFSKDITAEWKTLYDSAFEGSSYTITYKFKMDTGNSYSLISFNPIFNNQNVCIGVACYSKDVSERMRYIKAIEEQNEKLKSIAWTQSHMVRGPLSRLMGLVNLMKDDGVKEEELDSFLNHIKHSAEEIDHIVRQIVEKSTEIKE